KTARPWQPADTSRLVSLLDEGNADALVQQLAASGTLGAEAMRLLPEVVELLIRQHREPSADVSDLCYELVWQVQERASEDVRLPGQQPGAGLVFAATEDVALAQGLGHAGRRCINVRPDTAYARHAPNLWGIRAGDGGDYRRLLEDVAAEAALEG